MPIDAAFLFCSTTKIGMTFCSADFSNVKAQVNSNPDQVPQLNHPAADDVRQALLRLFAVNPFRDSPQLSAFLKFVVEETLQGRGGDLKGYTIATMALGRRDDFDPQTDPIVRVQAGRVRQAIQDYYDAHPEDPLRIQFVKGSYEPQFLFTEKAGLKNSSKAVSTGHLLSESSRSEGSRSEGFRPLETTPHGKFQKQQYAILGFAMVIAMLGFVSLVLLSGLFPMPANRAPIVRQSFFPTVIVDTSLGPSDPLEIISVIQRTQDALARFDDIILVRDTHDERGGSQVAPVRQKAEQLVLRIFGSYADRGRVRISARLVEQFDQRVVWVKEFEPVVSGTGGDDARGEIVRSIATAIARPYGAIHAYTRQVFGDGPNAQSDFGCLILVFDYRLSNDQARHQAARHCLEDQISKSPKVGALHSQLASLYIDEYQQGFNILPKPPLDRALAAATRGVNLAPASARSYQSLMNVHFSRKEMPSAWRSAEQALKLNPFDTEIQADVAIRYIQSGQILKGTQELEEALSYNSTPPDWTTTYLALAKYVVGREDEAAIIGKPLRTSEFALALLGSVILSHHADDRAGALEALASLKQKHPLIHANPAVYLERSNFDRGFAERFMVRYRSALSWLGQPS
jgi:hypothetical protein